MKVIGNPLHEIGDDAENTVIESKAQLVEYLESGCKSSERIRLGSEQEKFVYRSKDYSPAAYDGPDPGIKALLESMSSFGWKPIDENGLPIGLCKGDRAITLEPGGQLELSGAALRDVHQVSRETETHRDELKTLARALGLSFLALGTNPSCRARNYRGCPRIAIESCGPICRSVVRWVST